jgi:hypothetical protein
VQNQSKRQGDDNYKAFRQKLWSFPQLFLLQTLFKHNLSNSQRLQVLKLLKEAWIKPVELSPAALFGRPAKLCDSVEVLHGDAKKCRDFLKKISETLPFLVVPDFDQEINELCNTTKEKIYPHILSPNVEDSGTVEIETQAQLEVETELKSQTSKEEHFYELGWFDGMWANVSDLSSSILKSYQTYTPLFPLAKQMAREPNLREYAPFFKDILISANILQWRKGEKDINNMRLFGPNPMPFHHLFVKGDEVKLGTLAEMQVMSDDPSYYNLHLGFKDPEKKLSEGAFQKIIKLKFIDGESSYSQKELEFLEKWLQEAGVDRMYRLFTQMILTHQPEKLAAFQASSLQRTFAKLQNQ